MMNITNKLLKRLSLYLFLILFSFQTPSWADDIRDFEIEGMSVGDSLLDYFSEDEIKNASKNQYPNSKKYTIRLFQSLPKFKIYDGVQATYKTNDKKYKIYALAGVLWFDTTDNNIENCYKKKDEIVKEITEFFKDESIKIEEDNDKHVSDKSGKSTYKSIDFWFNSGDRMGVICNDWSEEMKFADRLKVTMALKEFLNFLDNEAFP